MCCLAITIFAELSLSLACHHKSHALGPVRLKMFNCVAMLRLQLLDLQQAIKEGASPQSPCV